MVASHSKRSRDDREYDPRFSGDAYQRAQGEVPQGHAGTFRARHQWHGQTSQPQYQEAADQDLEHQIQHLQGNLYARVRNIRTKEAANSAETQLLQSRLESLGEREQQVLERELAVKRQEDQVQTQQATLKQLQQDLMQQYNEVVASLPKFEDRLSAARQLLPESADASGSSLKPCCAEPAASAAAPQQQPASPAQPHPPLQPECGLGAGTASPHVQTREQQHGQDAAQLHVAKDEDVKGIQDAATASPTDPSLFPPSTQQHIPSTASAADPVSLPALPPSLPISPTAVPQPASQPPQLPVLQQPMSQPALSPQLQSAHLPASQSSLAQVAHVSEQETSTPTGLAPSVNGTDAASLPQTHVETLLPGTHDACPQPSGTVNPPDGKPFSTQTNGDRTSSRLQKKAQLNAVQHHMIDKSRHATGQSNGSSPHLSVPDVQAKPSSEQPQLRVGLRSGKEAAVNAEKAGMLKRVKLPDAAADKQGSESERNGSWDVPSPSSSSRGGGRGRGFGRAGRRGRSRSNLHRTSHPEPAGDLDVAVQALKATTGLTDLPASQAENRENEANAPTDDDLKPCFMRRVALDKSPDGRSSLLETALQTEACMHDGNPRPVVRRRTEPTNAATQAAAKAVLQREVPDLLEILQQKGLADQVGLLEHATSAVDERSDSLEQENLYFSMHSILARICEGKASSWQGRNTAGVKACGGDGEDSGRHEYCLMALEYLLERAHAYSAASEAVRWGWCRALSSFVFVFESANRIVVEKPCYGHATYFFDLEEPLPVADQVQRLIAVLSVPGVSRRKMLEGVSLDPGPELTLQERKQLEAAGWTPGTTIRSLLNFTGDRIFHQSAEVMTGQKSLPQNVLDYKDKIAKVLSDGASGGRVTKLCT